MKRIPVILLCAAMLWGCGHRDSVDPFGEIPFDGTAYHPVYMTASEARKIEVLAARDLKEPGKIYLMEPYLFINETGRGIHIVDNTDPANPEKISFVSIPGNHDMAAKGGWLYADNANDLVVFDISDPRAVKLVKRVEKALPAQNFPPYNNVYFECADPSKGIVVGWEKVAVSQKPKCKR